MTASLPGSDELFAQTLSTRGSSAGDQSSPHDWHCSNPTTTFPLERGSAVVFPAVDTFPNFPEATVAELECCRSSPRSSSALDFCPVIRSHPTEQSHSGSHRISSTGEVRCPWWKGSKARSNQKAQAFKFVLRMKGLINQLIAGLPHVMHGVLTDGVLVKSAERHTEGDSPITEGPITVYINSNASALIATLWRCWCQ